MNTGRDDRTGGPPTRRILVVEDDFGILDLLAIWLEQMGWSVTTATDGREALAYMQRGVHDVVLLDLMMPVLDGWSVLAVRRDDEALRAIPVVVMSADGSGHERAHALGADGWLSKPFDLDSIVTTVEGVSVRRPANHQRASVVDTLSGEQRRGTHGNQPRYSDGRMPEGRAFRPSAFGPVNRGWLAVLLG